MGGIAARTRHDFDFAEFDHRGERHEQAWRTQCTTGIAKKEGEQNEEKNDSAAELKKNTRN